MVKRKVHTRKESHGCNPRHDQRAKGASNVQKGAWDHSAATVHGHKSLRKSCIICGIEHSKNAHRQHGEFAFEDTHDPKSGPCKAKRKRKG